MESLRYSAKIEGEDLHLPEHIAAILEPDVEVEVLLRPVKRASPPAGQDLDDVINDIEKMMVAKYPNIAKPINEKLRRIAGISSQIGGDYGKYSDKEIIAMSLMEKHLEKEEIIESHF